VARKLHRENGLAVERDRNVIATLGCKEGLTLALMATINPGDEVIV
jgi:aminotransferase